MKPIKKLTKKILRILQKLNQREYLHHFGPKKFKLIHHLLALMMKEILRCSFRRCEKLLGIFGLKIPTYSALCKNRKRISPTLFDGILKLTAGEISNSVAVDSTGFSRTNPSYHYVKRIAAKKPIKNFAKLSAFFDLPTRKFTVLKIRIKPRHDIKDVNYLLRNSLPTAKLFADSTYDAESIHEKCFELKIQTIIKPRKNVRKGFYRRKQRKKFDGKEYHQRSLIEAGFGSLKRK